MPDDRIGRFRIIRKLANGGMGELYLVLDDEHAAGRTLVLKLMHKHLSDIEEFMQMFEQEGKLACRIDHPNIVRSHEYGKIENRPYILMDYYHSVRLYDLMSPFLHSGKPMPQDVSLSILLDIARALEYIHTLKDDSGQPLNVVHRDVNPKNVLVEFESGRALLCDFGVAKSALSSYETRPGVFRGRFAYMSPEQLAGERVDFRSDLYSLGIIACEMCCGRRLFPFRSIEDVFEPVNPARELLHEGISKPLAELIESLLEPDKENRPKDSAEVVEVLYSCMDDEAVARKKLIRLVEELNE